MWDQNVTYESLRAYYWWWKSSFCGFAPFLMMHLCLLRVEFATLRNSATPTLSPSFCLCVFTKSLVLFNYGFSAQSLLTGGVSEGELAEIQTADRVQKSLHITLNLLRWLAHGAKHSLTLSVSQMRTDSEQTLNTFNSSCCQHLQAIPIVEYAATHTHTHICI